VDDDVAGKDSQRHAGAGAAVAALVTPGRTSARRFGEEETFDSVLRREFRGCDLVLVEGYKSLAMPKIEVIRTGVSRPEVVEPVARISDGPFQGTVPTLSFGDWDAIVATVLRAAGLDRENREAGNGSRKTA
jgi:molybdopterin-guanine dinucleotide biosynthesis adapter protein